MTQGGGLADNECRLLGPFALIVQASMGFLALTSLVWKRSREYPNRRPWLIWFFDVSKQVFGAFGVHVLNVFFSIFHKSIAGLANGVPRVWGKPDDNPCDWYFLNILFDTTIGIPVLWFFLYIFSALAVKAGVHGTMSGQYGHPPKWNYYWRQLGLYFIGLVCMKIVIYGVLQFVPGLIEFADFLLSWSDRYPRFQIAFVVLIFPLFMNALQYYVIDSIIQSPEYKHDRHHAYHSYGALGQPEEEEPGY